ncbi:MAG: hypothetical protein WA737_08560 [Candidatus Acidiferrales bacterium]
MRLSTIFSDSNKVGLRRALLVCAAASALALAPQGAFAQHGGGGASGGGGHAGGGMSRGGGASTSSGGYSGGHSSGSWSGGVNEGSAGSAARGSTSARGGSASNGGGHWWSGIFGGGHGTAENGPAKTGTTGNSVARTDNLAMHNTWVNPPSRGFAATRMASMNRSDSFAFLRTPAANSRSAVRLGHWGPRYQPTYYYVPPFYYGYGGYDGCGFYWFGPCSGLGFGWGSGYGFGLGFGWAGPYGSGWATGCDPMWGCGYGYSNYDMSGTAGGASGGDYTIDAGGQSDSGSGASADAQENSPSSYEAGPGSAEAGNSANANPATAAANAQPFVLFMKDGSSYAVTDYWLASGKLHYVTTYRGENTVDLSRLDVQKTVDRNAANGMKFELRSAPLATQTGATATAAPGETTAPAELQSTPQAPQH